MITVEEGRKIEKIGDFKPHSFGIKDVGKMFKILVDGLYSDTHGSLIREITSNAIDANAESGSKNKVQVKWIEENRISGVTESLIIKDSGIGISEDRMFNVFCFLGESTKSLNNNEIGGFGIGAKVIYKYTDVFTIKTINKGVEYIYITNLNEEGIAEMNLISFEDTTFPSGTEIVIPVKKWDKNDFQKAINSQLGYFNNIEYIGFDTPKIEIVEEHDLYTIVKNPYHNKAHITIGNVAYELDYFKLNITSYYSPNIRIKFNIGELIPTASRESLNYNKQTIDTINNRIESIKEYLIKDINEKVSTENNYFEWASLISKYKETNIFKWLYINTDFTFKDEINYGAGVLNIFGKFHSIQNRKGSRYNAPKKVYVEEESIIKTENLYYKTGDFSTAKNEYLAEDNLFQCFTIYSDYSKYFNSVAEGATLITEEFWDNWKDKIVSDFKEIAEDYNLVETPDSYLAVKVKKTKSISEISYKVVCYSSGNYHFSDSWEYRISKMYISQMDNYTWIYGYSEQSELLLKVSSILSSSDKYFSYSQFKDNYRVVKISKENVIYLPMEAIFVGDIFDLSQPLGQDIINIVTANKYDSRVYCLDYIYKSLFIDIMSNEYSIYGVLNTFIRNNNNDNRRRNTDFFNELFEIVKKDDLFNPTFVANYNKLKESLDRFPLLEYLDKDSPVEEVEEYINFKLTKNEPNSCLIDTNQFSIEFA